MHDTCFLSDYRQYEEKQLKTQQERAQKRLEFSNQESKLKSQVRFAYLKCREELPP